MIDDRLWIEDDPFVFAGIALGRRMTVIRLSDGSLFVHSPGEMTIERKQRLEELGAVRYIVAPGRFHDLFLDQALDAFPSSELHAIFPVFSRFSARPKTFLLSDRSPHPWRDEIEQHDFWAGPLHSETVFFHRKSRSLLLTDLCFLLTDRGWMTQLAGRGFGVYNRFAPTRDIRLWTLGRRHRVQASVAKVLEWPFTKIIPAHGEIVGENGRAIFRAAFRWVSEQSVTD